MRPLKSHFPENALRTLETVLKQTQKARVFRRAQAVREVVAGHHITTVSATFHLANSALRKWVQRGPRACSIARAPGGRPKSHASWSNTSSAWSSKTPSNMAPSRPSGVAVNSRPS
jgi:hypothetical protein